LNIFIIHIGSCYIAYVVKRRGLYYITRGTLVRLTGDRRRFHLRASRACAIHHRNEEIDIIMPARSFFRRRIGNRRQSFIFSLSSLPGLISPFSFTRGEKRQRKRQRERERERAFSPSFSDTGYRRKRSSGNTKRSRMESDQPRINSSTAA